MHRTTFQNELSMYCRSIGRMYDFVVQQNSTYRIDVNIYEVAVSSSYFCLFLGILFLVTVSSIKRTKFHSHVLVCRFSVLASFFSLLIEPCWKLGNFFFITVSFAFTLSLSFSLWLFFFLHFITIQLKNGVLVTKHTHSSTRKKVGKQFI